MYNHLVSDPNCSLRWFCTTCDKQAMDTSNTCHNPDKMDRLVTMVEKLLDKLADFEGTVNDNCDVVVTNQLDARLKILEDRFAKQEQELPERFDAFKSNVTSQLDEKISKSVILDNSKNVNEDKEIDKRKNNMIIYRVPGVIASSADERNEVDLVYVTELLENVSQVNPKSTVSRNCSDWVDGWILVVYLNHCWWDSSILQSRTRYGQI